MARIARWGHSLAVRIPISVVENLRLTSGMECLLRPLDSGDILIRLATLKPGAILEDGTGSNAKIPERAGHDRW